jgi:nanoRNase/pAp phosphatase (c-di-AMP/oligoRNAs hydrolase)
LEKKPTFVIVLDQGSRSGPPVIDDPDVKSLLIDHHLSDEFPRDAQVSQIAEHEISKLTYFRLSQL